MVSNPFL